MPARRVGCVHRPRGLRRSSFPSPGSHSAGLEGVGRLVAGTRLGEDSVEPFGWTAARRPCGSPARAPGTRPACPRCPPCPVPGGGGVAGPSRTERPLCHRPHTGSLCGRCQRRFSVSSWMRWSQGPAGGAGGMAGRAGGSQGVCGVPGGGSLGQPGMPNSGWLPPPRDPHRPRAEGPPDCPLLIKAAPHTSPPATPTVCLPHPHPECFSRWPWGDPWLADGPCGSPSQPPKAMLSSSWTVFPGRLSGCFSDGLARQGLTGMQCM